MLAALTAIDYGVLALFLASILATGAYFSSRQKDTAEFFLASRSLGSLPLGLSLAAIFISLVGFTTLPAAAYDRGWLCWIVVLAFWLVLPVTAFVAIPLYRGLKLVSLYEYLEQRFDFRVRLTASLIFLVWRMLWLVAAIYLPCAAIRWASGWSIPVWTFVVAIGCLATVVAFLGGMRSAAWSGILAFIAIGGGAAIAIAGIWLNLKGGPERVAEIARGLSRLEPAEFHFEWTDTWALFSALPFWVLTVLTFCLADQVGAQRFLAAKNENLARTAYLICTLALSLLLPALIYLDTGLLAFYYDRPQEMRPEWVVNVDGKTRLPVRGANGRPLLDPANPADAVTFENIDRLVAEGRVLQPNSKEPFTSTAGLVDPDTNRVLIEKLAMRRPNNDRLRGEIIVRQDAPAEMLPHFARQHLSWGMAGIVVAALLASALAAIDATLNSLCTVIVRDLACPFESGRRWLARRVSKEPAQLTPTDELQLARPLTLVLGAGATLLAAVFAMNNSSAQGFGLVLSATSALGAPLLATFLLGMTSRRSTTSAALLSLSCGALVTLGLAIAGKLAAAGMLPERYQFAAIWPALGGFAFTFALGHLLSFIAGRPKSNADLRGLVVGCGELGHRATDEAIPLINIADESAEIRWK